MDGRQAVGEGGVGMKKGGEEKVIGGEAKCEGNGKMRRGEMLDDITAGGRGSWEK